MDRTDQPPEQPTPVLPEPSYARVVIDQIAALVDLAPPDSLIGSPGLRHLFTVAVAAELHELPTPVADEVAEKVDALLPPLAPDTTCGAYAPLLRTLAKTV